MRVEQEIRRDRLLVGIIRVVRLAGQGFVYLRSVRNRFTWATDEEFNQCVELLIEQNRISADNGRDGGVQLRLAPKQGE